MKRLASALLVSLTLGLGLTSTANASTVIAFDDVNTHGGNLSYSGTGGALYGTKILLDTITAINTSADGNYNCLACELSFTSGAYNSGLSSALNSYVFDAGGSIKVTGTMTDHFGHTVASGILAQGSFTDYVIASVVNNLMSVVIGNGTDEKNTELEKFFGIFNHPSWQFGTSVISADSVTGGAKVGDAFSAHVTNADFDNTPVPLPAAVWMFGAGLMGVLRFSRNKHHV